MAELTLNGISKHYGANTALSDVSLDIQSGEFICLLGASGCGKTTLLRVIAGLEQHDSGQIFLDGTDLTAVPCHKRNIGMVFQSLALFPHLNVGENIAYGPRMHGSSIEERQRQAARLLEMVGLSGLDNRTVSSLSGGQRQRVAIARALALNPEIFLMDEPFSALDAGLRDHLQAEVRKLQQSLGITTVFVTHDQREAMAIADRIVVLHDGMIAQVGSATEIYQQPATRFVAEFIGNNNLLDVNVTADSVQFAQWHLTPPPAVLNTIQPGGQTLIIRPEQITLSKVETGTRQVQGEVAMVRHVGALVEYDIDVAGSIIKQTAFQGAMTALKTGDRVSLSWDWGQIWVLPS